MMVVHYGSLFLPQNEKKKLHLRDIKSQMQKVTLQEIKSLLKR